MATMKYASIDFGTAEAVFNKLGGLGGIRRFLADELVVSEPTRSWCEEDGVIHFLVTSDGTSGVDWVKRLEKKGFRVGDYAKQLLRSDDFKPTNGVTYKVAVLKGMLFSDNDRITSKVRAEATCHNLSVPNAEVACLIREKFTDKELVAMGLWWIIVMHEPIKDSGGGPRLLDVSRDNDGSWLDSYYDDPDCRWYREDGFAFVASQVSA